ncbi:Cyclin-dependent protein kinase regulator Pho80 [Pyrenophora tritici-repentis]|uniref:Cyclin-dependent protein kinase regulator Pho80 n=2 Tax=Pyrenophora tritici-repentis TaxID=45151 RepID=A0A922NFM9_9PLEO|nr:cyclin-dependent protein kinase regulator Pho80 [Pyrenophora tritici-repentis Pt-1C-BFP]EDU46535.1 cyclin-dependent protein kinase regulator Pho80 [Pyrenophora tritici-repentis Pt-1C-BFP]KAI1517009.1 Cyclin-dependent protein kinase regulator Pho80 [Pyrenophora tritici-repentis]KAI1670435.1 Cyclin-dependent protein kinase regulator Pho80 [Pyrenophora tritici-repentis]KAI1682056.1 Cyclin-dependent protein kinase regulator Pho80 [Pyrenophora tritici-repentis]
MITSSPTISQPPSPSTTFHTPSHRPYHASRRTSTSSPRFAVTTAAARRFDAPSNSAPSPVPTVASSPQGPKRSYVDSGTQFVSSPQGQKKSYVDSGTQYTPGLSPTNRPVSHINLTTSHGDGDGNGDGAQTNAIPAPLSAAAIASEARGIASAAPVVTEPPEPQLRVTPQPATPAQNAQSQSRRTSHESTRSAVESAGVTREASTVLQVPASPAKRARPEEPSVKVMPLQYETCDVKDLGILISDMLMELVRLNDGYPLRDGTLTRFHSRAPPGISVRDYLSRLIVHATLSPPILLSMVFYVDKLCAMYPAFTISSLTVHRFLITAATVAAKGLSDSFWTNSLYARVGGVSVRELALLELEFLRRLEWRIVPKPEVLVDYYKGLVDRGPGYVMEKEKEKEQERGPSVDSAQVLSATGIHTNQSGV